MADERTKVTLGDEQRSVARARILRAARDVLCTHGFRSTADDVAAAAEVSRRTVFRYFPSQGHLLAVAVMDIVDELTSSVSKLAASAEDVDGWLLAATTEMHRLHRDLVGQAFWDLYADRPETAPELAEVLQSLDQFRRSVGTDFANAAWRASSGAGKAPAWVVDAITLQISGFAYKGLALGRDGSPEETGQLAAKTIAAVLAAAIAERDARRSAPYRGTSKKS